MPQRTKALLTLILTAPVLTEIVSGNTPVRRFLDPRVPVFFLVAYSLPLVVIREAAFRRRISLAGVFILGLAYGIWNEGLLAQTLIRLDHVPINKFDRYIYSAGFNFSWAAVIVPWHAMLAIIFPIALVTAVFPSVKGEAWIGEKTFRIASVALAVLVLFEGIVRKPHAQMIACAAAIFILSLAAVLFCRGEAPDGRSRGTVFPFVAGLLAYPAFIVPAILTAAHRTQPLLYFATVATIFGGLWVLGWHFGLRADMAQVGLGAYLAASCFNLVAGVAQHSLERILTGAILAIIFVAIQVRGLSRVPASSGVTGVIAENEAVAEHKID